MGRIRSQGVLFVCSCFVIVCAIHEIASCTIWEIIRRRPFVFVFGGVAFITTSISISISMLLASCWHLFRLYPGNGRHEWIQLHGNRDDQVQKTTQLCTLISYMTRYQAHTCLSKLAVLYLIAVSISLRMPRSRKRGTWRAIAESTETRIAADDCSNRSLVRLALSLCPKFWAM